MATPRHSKKTRSPVNRAQVDYLRRQMELYEAAKLVLLETETKEGLLRITIP